MLLDLDSLLKYYGYIESSKLSEDKIDIDENLVIENSFDKYIETFVTFLNNLYYNRIAISESIFKKLMDIIDYEGYEYQIIKNYIEILLNNMPDNSEVNINNKDSSYSFTTEEGIDFINKYLEALQSGSVNSLSFPHYQKVVTLVDSIQGEEEDSAFTVNIFKETENPIDVIAENISGVNLEVFISSLYILYKNDINTYLKVLGSYKYPLEGLVFLLDETDYVYIDILLEFVEDFRNLNNLISYYYSTFGEISGIAHTNIIRLSEILMLNLANNNVVSQIANNIPFWKDIISPDNKLLYNIMKDVDIKWSTEFSPYGYYINYINNSHKDDIYFYLRYLLLNIDYRIICDNFITFIKEIETKVSHDELISVFDEWLIALSRLNNNDVNNKLKEFKTELASYHEETFNHFINTINERIK